MALGKIICDACSVEIESVSQSFNALIHIVEFIEYGMVGYVDRNFTPVSGREEHYDLCPSCYNAIYFQAYKVFKTIREQTQNGKNN